MTWLYMLPAVSAALYLSCGQFHNAVRPTTEQICVAAKEFSTWQLAFRSTWALVPWNAKALTPQRAESSLSCVAWPAARLGLRKRGPACRGATQQPVVVPAALSNTSHRLGCMLMRWLMGSTTRSTVSLAACSRPTTPVIQAPGLRARREGKSGGGYTRETNVLTMSAAKAPGNIKASCASKWLRRHDETDTMFVTPRPVESQTLNGD